MFDKPTKSFQIIFKLFNYESQNYGKSNSKLSFGEFRF